MARKANTGAAFTMMHHRRVLGLIHWFVSRQDAKSAKKYPAMQAEKSFWMEAREEISLFSKSLRTLIFSLALLASWRFRPSFAQSGEAGARAGSG